MKKIQLTLGVFVALLLAASMANAQDYPASNFQPKVIYSSEAAVAGSSSATSPCPAKAEQSEVDPKYPASSFQPKVIFSDASAK